MSHLRIKNVENFIQYSIKIAALATKNNIGKTA